MALFEWNIRLKITDNEAKAKKKASQIVDVTITPQQAARIIKILWEKEEV